MNYYKVMAEILDMPEQQVYYSIRYIVVTMKKYIVESEVDQSPEEANLLDNDLAILTEMLNILPKDLTFEVDTIIECTLLYFYFMQIVHGHHRMDCIRDYFGIKNYNEVIMKNISHFSKAYFNSISKFYTSPFA